MKFNRRRIVLVAFLIPLLGLLAAAGYYVYQKDQTDRALARVLAQLDRDEPGWRLDDLEGKRPVIPPEQDSARLILKLHAQIPNGWATFNADETWSEAAPGAPL